MSLSRFESRFVRLQEEFPTGLTAPVVLRRALAMLADLAADTLEPDTDRARALLVEAARRIETLFHEWPDVVVPLADWRRTVTLFPADCGRTLRCQAIREAERLMRHMQSLEDTPVAEEETYRSSSMSQ